jgi:hypothetical protein
MINTSKRRNQKKHKKAVLPVLTSSLGPVGPLFDLRRPFHRSHALAAVTNIVLIESKESRAPAARAVHVVISVSFEWDKASALAHGTGSVLIQ